MSKPIARVVISQSELFAGWPEPALARLVDAAEVLSFEEGASLHRPGDAAEYLYLIAAGSLRLTRQSPSGRRFTAWLQFAGDFHGLGSVVTQTPHIYEAICKGSTQLVRLPGSIIRDILRRDGNLALEMFARFYRRHRNAVRLYETAATHGLRSRIAALLQSVLVRSRRAGANAAIDLSQDEIASMLGTRRQVVNRELRAIAASGAVRVDYGRITVLDAEALSALALEAD